MEAHATDITGAATVALIALVCGILMARLRQPAIIGYILAGVVLGPPGFGLVEDRGQIGALAELGVLMLLFVVGMELNIKRFMEVWRLATLATLAQIAASVGVMLALRFILGWSLGLAVLVGFVVALSSTAVVIKVLETMGERNSEPGRLAVAVLIAQDMAVAPMMLIIGGFKETELNLLDLGRVALSVAVLAGVLWVLVKRDVKLPFGDLISRHDDLAPLTGLAFCFGAAALAGLLGLSAAYGAFLAGMALGNSPYRRDMLHATRPVQSVLMMIFFLSIGMLLDLSFIWENLGTVLLLLLLVTVFKTALNIGALGLLGATWPCAFVAGAALAQIGEFSFLLAGQGMEIGLVEEKQFQQVVAVTILSLIISPLWLAAAKRLHGVAGGDLPEVLNTAYGKEARALRHICRHLPTLARLLGIKYCATVVQDKLPKKKAKNDAGPEL